MSWTCEQCGWSNEDLLRACEHCGYEPMPARLVLTSVATGKTKGMRITTSIGRELLKTFAGEDARFASDPQFDLVKDEKRRAWMICHHGEAANPTYYNGAALDAEARPVENGATITVGPDSLKLTIGLEK